LKKKTIHYNSQKSKIDINREIPVEQKQSIDLYPKFSLQFLQKQSKYCLSCCQVRQKAAFADRIKELSSLTWRQIISAPIHGQGFEKINIQSFTITVPDDFKHKNIIAFRFSGIHPMVGFRDHDTFYILWFDHNMTLYRHG
jgi:hypothetical protein